MSSGRKTCSKCGKDWPRSMYYKDRDVRDGLRAECKKCHRTQNHAARLKRHSVLGGYGRGGDQQNEDHERKVKPVNLNLSRHYSVEHVRDFKSKAMGSEEPQLHAVIPDIHVPYQDNAACSAAFAFLADQRLDSATFLGDVLDCAPVSPWLEGNIRRSFTAGTWEETLEAGTNFLDWATPQLRAKNEAAPIFYLEGNHEAWPVRYADRFPKFADRLDVERALELPKRGIQYVRYWTRNESVTLGKLRLIHGRIYRVHHAKAHLQKYGESVLYGHCHDLQATGQTTWGRGNPRYAQSCGCLCRFDPDFKQGEPHDWAHAVVLVWTWSDGSWLHHVYPILGGVLRALGKTYRG